MQQSLANSSVSFACELAVPTWVLFIDKERKPKVMESVIEVLEREGFKVKLNNSKVIVKLDGLANPVTISKDHADNRYKVGTNDWGMSLGAFLLLIFGLQGFGESGGDSLINALVFGGAAWLFVAVILTELKSAKLRTLVDRLNGEAST
ncbi:hypothetical protein L1D29_11345 [Shewanella insulae]|uniref:hypothetical protein n=1 Tax=Shewanella insulae TaxID=2681496 RepID=UPI001EFDFDAE|nr:hypothetical protein [Shewanella insulae]MCG9713406.1 hypothetical protein [Shewanella insulae]